MSKSEKLPSYGGQALIEGVLMRGTNSLAAAMRGSDGTIIIEKESLTGIYQSPLRKIPFLRGMIILWDALGLGMRFLTISANLQAPKEEKLDGKSLVGTVIFSLTLAVALFFISPAVISQSIEKFTGWDRFTGTVLEGIIRLLILIGYIWAVGKIPEIGRVFAYHGAEHKTINAYEAGEILTPSNVMKYTLAHPRCGTAFMLTLVVLSIFVFSLLGPMSFELRLVSRVLMIPLLAGIAYEYIRWTANHIHLWVVKILVAPNLALQKLTTREPDENMVEVAICALNAVLSNEKPVTAVPG
jgi:uncharacterized protein YqhQ